MSEMQMKSLERQDRIADLFQEALKLKSSDEKVRSEANIDELLDFLSNEYEVARGNAPVALDA